MENEIIVAVVAFAKEHILALLVATAYYFLAGLITAVLGKRTRIDAWCDEHVAVAVVLNLLRATGFDFWKILTQLKVLFLSRATFGTALKLLPVLLVASIGIAAQGCSLEAARQARINSQLKAGTYSAQTRPDAECKALDSVHIYTAYGAELSLGVGTAAGVLAAADTSDDVRKVAIGTGIGAGVVAAGLGAWSASSGKAWTEQCSQ